MTKTILTTLAFICLAFIGKSQNLTSFTTNMQTGNYLSIANKKAYSIPDAKNNKSVIDLALTIRKDGSKQIMEWHNLSGKDEIIPEDMRGTVTIINGISFDRDQFDKCKTNADFKRMTGHITNSSFSHFASITDDVAKGISYHCFIIQMENGKRAVMWLDAGEGNSYKVFVKVQP